MVSLVEAWFSLIAAIMFGVLGTVSMKLSDCFQKTKPTVAMAVFYCCSFIAMTFSLKTIDVSTVYAIWSGIGTIFVTMIGVFFFHENISLRKIFFLGLIILGVLGINIHDFH